MEKLEIFGITTDKCFSDFGDHFAKSDWSDNETMYFESTKTFHHDDDDFSFGYKFIVEFVERYWMNKKDYDVSLEMVVLPESCKNLEKVAGSAGIETDEVTWWDLLTEGGYNVSFGRTTCEKEEIDEIVLKISHVYEMMNNLRGFYFDKPWNRIGTNGWDTIRHAVL